MQHAPRLVGFLVYDDVQALDLTGPLDAFGIANGVAGEEKRSPFYRLVTIGLDRSVAASETGLRLVPELTLEEAPALDTLIVPGGRGSRRLADHAPLMRWLQERRDTRRLASVCTGAFVLAAAGLLDGRRVTTHWHFAAALAAACPAADVAPASLHVVDGNVHSSGGLTAGIDLALAMIEADCGAAVATRVARYLVVYLRRAGDQSQYSAPLEGQLRAQGRMRELVDWLLTRLERSTSVDEMAAHVAMSTRHFQRVFREQFDVGPAKFLQRLRVERAAVLLTAGDMSLKRIAGQTGFASVDVLGRAFRSRYGMAPGEYRQRFGGGPTRDDGVA